MNMLMIEQSIGSESCANVTTMAFENATKKRCNARKAVAVLSCYLLIRAVMSERC
jgi:hypothetical protein